MKHPAPYLPFALAVIIGLGAFSCSSPGTRVLPEPVVGQVAATLDRPDGLGTETRAVLAREDLLGSFRADPAEAVRQLNARWAGELNDSRRAELAGVCSAGANRIEDHDPQGATGLRLTAAEIAWPLAIAGQANPDRRTCRALYNHNCGVVAEGLFDLLRAGTRSAGFSGPLKSYRLRVVSSGTDRIDPAMFDTLVRSNRVKLHRVKLKRHRVEGLGADLVGHREWSPERASDNPLLARAGMALPVNALLDFSGSAGSPELVFRDMTLATSVRAGGSRHPLSADFTAPVATLLDYTEIAKASYGFMDMLRSTEHEDTTGIYQLEPWREDKIPVLLVHGLMSSPATWLTVLNELMAEPLLRERYQFLAYRYQTGFPVGNNAAEFRRHLREMEKQVDPRGRNPKLRQMVMIGHSMGGMLTNMQIRSSGEKIRKVLFDRDLDEIDMTPEQRRATAELVYFEADPNIRRAVFVATPHRGSEIASNPIGRLGIKLIKLPVDVLTLGLSRRESLDGTTPFGQQMLHQGSDSVKALQPENPMLGASLQLPVRRGTTTHSVIGNHNDKEPLAESSDLLVPYWSSHLDITSSEKIVRASHTTITHNADAIEELRRILYLHAGISYRPQEKQ